MNNLSLKNFSSLLKTGHLVKWFDRKRLSKQKHPINFYTESTKIFLGGNKSVGALANKIRSSSPIKCHVYNHVGGEGAHPCAATKLRNPTQAIIPVTKNNNKLFFSIRYLESSSSIKCHVYNHVGGRRHISVSATKVGNLISATIPVTKTQPTNFFSSIRCHGSSSSIRCHVE